MHVSSFNEHQEQQQLLSSSFRGVWIAPTILSITFMVTMITVLDCPRVLRERMKTGPGWGKKSELPFKETFAMWILFFLALVTLTLSGYDASRGQNDLLSTYCSKHNFVTIGSQLFSTLTIVNAIGVVLVFSSFTQIARVLHANKRGNKLLKRDRTLLFVIQCMRI